MSDNPREIQHYLPGCAPGDEASGVVRAEVHRFSLLLRGMLRHYNVSLEEAQTSVASIFRELGRK